MNSYQQIKTYLQSVSEGTIVTAKSLLSYGSRTAVDLALMRLTRAGEIERVARGVYCKPFISRFTGKAFVPAASEIVKQLAVAQGEVIAPHGAVAVNYFGLSTQVPLQLILLTTGRSKTVQFGWQTVRYKHVAKSKLPAGDRLAGLAVTALHYLNTTKEATPKNAAKILNSLPVEERNHFMSLLPRLPTWMIEVVGQATQVAAHA